MGRQNNNQIVIPSSIALLQERFRQLQRVKEMREERELLKMVMLQEEEEPSYSDINSNYNYYDHDYKDELKDQKLFFHFLPQKTTQLPLFLCSPVQPKQSKLADDVGGGGLVKNDPLLMSLCPFEHVKQKHDDFQNESSSCSVIDEVDGFEVDYDCSDVDTSLHL